MPTDTEFPFRHFLWHTGLRWKYSNLLPHGTDLVFSYRYFYDDQIKENMMVLAVARMGKTINEYRILFGVTEVRRALGNSRRRS
jgi:hypothetical protein